MEASRYKKLIAIGVLVVVVIAGFALWKLAGRHGGQGGIKNGPSTAQESLTVTKVPDLSYQDSDSDGLIDDYELKYKFNPAVPDWGQAGLDSDHDGISDANEAILGTDSGKPDSDGDGVPDYYEVLSGHDPKQADFLKRPDRSNEDPDQDGLTNAQEQKYKTNPSKADTDGDGYQDGEEVEHGYNPLGPGRL